MSESNYAVILEAGAAVPTICHHDNLVLGLALANNLTKKAAEEFVAKYKNKHGIGEN